MSISEERRQGVRARVKRHPVASFFVLAYTFSRLASIPAASGYGFMFFFTQLGPALATLIVTWSSGASVRGWTRKIVRWRVAPRWYAVVILIIATGGRLGLTSAPETRS